MLYGRSHLASANHLQKSKSTDEPVSVSLFYTVNVVTSLTLCYSSSDNILKVLGEGGFSFVYLAQDEHSGVRDALGRGCCIGTHVQVSN